MLTNAPPADLHTRGGHTMETLTSVQKMAAYERLTRVLRNMHHTERTILDTHPHYEQILTLIHQGRDAEALALAEPIRTEQGDAWRAKQAA